MLNLPTHIRRLRIVTLEQAALAMAGLFDCDDIEMARNGNYLGWRKAETYRETILQAIKLKEIIPLRLTLSSPIYEKYLTKDSMTIDLDKVDIDMQISDAKFLASDIWSWAESELSEFDYHEKYSDKASGYESQVSSEVGNQINDIQWESRFAGRKHAIEIIAALSKTLAEKTGHRFTRGDSINASALAEIVASHLGIKDPQLHRKLIADALKEAGLADRD
ncbi:hypothetical protein ACYBNF_06270 [Klebsiella pneumoniae]|uniref:hypothetical protein n=1 Tax=Klebsiella pneumoniae TaxID=573 RepID=UPI001CBCBB0C|nr:hypothetical protein [Klebsiella pneumoniae]MBZ1626583.1 hypothetical protein [Klebsiella pneumoniae]HBY5479204.1 hypothetical protein [Klebsiella pneumoniae]HBZ1331886.1 hypothetical protein [Klebsiella pneumoniae]HCT4945719.1 hypothetical protein [Klebsiella pneumoniae]